MRSFCAVNTAGTHCSFDLSIGALQFFSEFELNIELSTIFGGEPLDRVEANNDQRAVGGIWPGNTEGTLIVLEARARDSQITTQLQHLGFQRPTPAEILGSEYDLRTDTWICAPAGGGQIEINQQLRSLADFLSKHKDILRSIQREAEFVVRCYDIIPHETGGIDISVEGLVQPLAMDIPFRFDLNLGGRPTGGPR